MPLRVYVQRRGRSVLKVTGENPRVRINMVVEGELAEWLKDWKKRGLVKSFNDAARQGLRAFHEKISEQDLKSLQLKNLRNIEEQF